MDEYGDLHSLIRFYQKQLKTQCNTLTQQELIISKLSNHITANLKNRHKDKMREIELEMKNPTLTTNQKAMMELNYNSNGAVKTNHFSALYKFEAFDFYGKEIRLHADEAERTFKQSTIRKRDLELTDLRDEVEMLKVENDQQRDLLKLSIDAEMKLKQDMFSLE